MHAGGGGAWVWARAWIGARAGEGGGEGKVHFLGGERGGNAGLCVRGLRGEGAYT